MYMLLKKKKKGKIDKENQINLQLYMKAIKITKEKLGVPIVVQQKQIQLVTTRFWVQSLASLSGLRIWRCGELWCR